MGDSAVALRLRTVAATDERAAAELGLWFNDQCRDRATSHEIESCAQALGFSCEAAVADGRVACSYSGVIRSRSTKFAIHPLIVTSRGNWHIVSIGARLSCADSVCEVRREAEVIQQGQMAP
ncbi:MAG: hypothetical protein ABL932_13040 [Terricaulis sp.]